MTAFRAKTTTDAPKGAALSIDEHEAVLAAKAALTALEARKPGLQTDATRAATEARQCQTALDQLELHAAIATLDGKDLSADVKGAAAKLQTAESAARLAAGVVRALEQKIQDATDKARVVEGHAAHDVQMNFWRAYLAALEREIAAYVVVEAVLAERIAVFKLAEEEFPRGGPAGARRAAAKIAVNGELAGLHRGTGIVAGWRQSAEQEIAKLRDLLDPVPAKRAQVESQLAALDA